MSNLGKAIGGYFELELPAEGCLPYENAFTFQSARTALLVALKASGAQRLWLPHFICASVIDQAKAGGLDICFYALNANLGVSDEVALADSDVLLYVNYFGICNGQVANVLARFDPMQVILDNSQAFYTAPGACLATIYSPRKFFGVPDGGLLITSMPIDMPDDVDTGSAERMRGLIKRLASTPEAGYADYQHAESSLVGAAPKRMSVLTERLLRAVDFESAKRRRRANFAALHVALGERNELTINLEQIDAPLCYPFLPRAAAFKAQLIEHRVFVPTYWPEVLLRGNTPQFEARLVQSLHPLPCDQRYQQDDMNRIIGLLMA